MLTTGLVYGLCCDVSPNGAGSRHILGGLADDSKDSFQVAITWACLNASWLGAMWGGGPAVPYPRRLFSAREDVTLRVSEGEHLKDGPSSSACAGLVLMRWLWSAREAEAKDVSVTGVLDLRGRLDGVSGMEEKARAAKEDGSVRLLVMPEKNFRYWAANDFAKVRG